MTRTPFLVNSQATLDLPAKDSVGSIEQPANDLRSRWSNRPIVPPIKPD